MFRLSRRGLALRVIITSPHVIHLPAYSAGAAAHGTRQYARQNAEYDPDSQDRHDAEQDKQRCLDHETLSSVGTSLTDARGESTSRAAAGFACEKKNLSVGDCRTLMAGRIGKSARGHPVVSNTGLTDIYPCKGGDWEEGPESTAGNVSTSIILFCSNRARKPAMLAAAI